MATRAQPSQVTMEKLTSLAKRRGFIFPSSEIYGGLGSTWDYGPLGVLMKNNVKAAWWRAMVQERDDIVGLDAAILMHPRVWEASGHLAGFADPLVECKACHQRFREDNVWVGVYVAPSTIQPVTVSTFASSETEARPAIQRTLQNTSGYRAGTEMLFTLNRLPTATLTPLDLVNRESVPCPSCGQRHTFTEPRMFNLMFKTFVGPVEGEAATVYLRPETAQGIFVNFENVQTTTRKKLPFGIAQIGKAFRNEITTGNFIFRCREFEQMELEYFVRPGDDEEWFRHWVQARLDWWTGLSIRPESLQVRPHAADELSHYSKATSDIEFKFPWGWGELEGIANRTDFDLAQHSRFSGKSLKYFDEESGQSILPYVIEPSSGVDRAVLALLVDAYDEGTAPTAEGGKAEGSPGREELRVVLRLHPAIAPIKVAVLPLSRREPLVNLAREVSGTLRKQWFVQYDDAQSIGRRYRRQDEIGTPYCVTIDFQSLDDGQVTIRDRDSMGQVRAPIAGLVEALRERLGP